MSYVTCMSYVTRATTRMSVTGGWGCGTFTSHATGLVSKRRRSSTTLYGKWCLKKQSAPTGAISVSRNIIDVESLES